MQTLRLVRTLAENDDRVTVCCYYEFDDEMVKRFESAGANLVLMKFERKDGLLRLAKGLYEIIKSRRPEIVHVQYITPGFVPVIAARLAGVKVIFASVHQPGRTYGWKAKFLLRSAVKLCTAFLCNSLSVEESWFGESALYDPLNVDGNRRHWTIYNTVDADQISQIVTETERQTLRTSLGLGDRPVIGCVARLREEKGQTVLLDAMVEVVKSVPEAILIMVGDGPDKEILRKKSETMMIDNHVKWMGQKSLEEVYLLYSIMNVVAVPSLFEGFGLSAAEAMAASLPVIASNVDGLSEVIEDGMSGHLVATGDSSAFATRIIELLRDPDKSMRFGRRGNLRVKKYYSYEKYNNQILSFYNSYST